MKKRYNIALLPAKKTKAITAYAQHFLEMSDNYILSDNSLPHVTLYQFEADDSEIDAIWNKVCDSMDQQSIELIFNDFSCLTFDGVTSWVSLLPNNFNALMQMHTIVAGVINQPVNINYDPHMTLANTKNPLYENLVDGLSKTYKPIRDVFVLSMGKADEVGQYTEIIYCG